MAIVLPTCSNVQNDEYRKAMSDLWQKPRENAAKASKTVQKSATMKHKKET
ncbi:predicted protein [Sclerotinia sclerotiorum 1980 UF-70]|uniref:Uncharacterized protein n=1 Tax=Sclerotinia sclerotiorum (strain ATCC 18683 / 1980 / Ss-1) TaxID=665079 RepID=A7EMY2_SCLS1|nr:predicted protein [Sclerotinia sclerotiorum 1980 UF-70]EDO04198.1 predicted protein [Sclerotinia sclerotiorum 1980 UF-70]